MLVDAAGRFRMDSLLFTGKAKLFYAYKDSKGKTKPALVSIDSDTLPQPVELIPSGMLGNMITRDINTNTSKEEVDTRYDYLKSRLNETKELEKVSSIMTLIKNLK